MGGNPNDGKRLIRLKHSRNINPFLVVLNCINIAKDITRAIISNTYEDYDLPE
jgi:hypothetical protein